MNENFNGFNCENKVFRPVENVYISGMNNSTYIYSSANTIKVNGMNQRVFCHYPNSRVNGIIIAGANNIIYLNQNSRNCNQNVSGANNRIIFTEQQNDNNRDNHQHNLNPYINAYNNNINPNNDNHLNERNDNNNINESNINNQDNDLGSAPIVHNVRNINNDEFLYSNRYDHDVIDEIKCSICLTNFKNDSLVKKMQCGHIYHKSCVEKLLERQIRDNNHPFCLICFQWEMQDKINGGN